MKSATFNVLDMTRRIMRKLCILTMLALTLATGHALLAQQPAAPAAEPVRQYPNVYLAVDTNPIAAIEGNVDDDLTDVMVPVPMKDRVYNKTGIQCVWASTELLGRYAEEPKLINLTDDPECKSYSGPASLARKLKQLNVKFEQTVSTSDRSLILKGVVKERRGVLFSIPGHAMVLVHYDEEKGIVKYINNSDRSLAVRTWTMAEFNRRWDGWVAIIYADNDIIAQKYAPKIPQLPIVDRNGSQGLYEKDYILQPMKN
jgi:hypothetical protein